MASDQIDPGGFKTLIPIVLPAPLPLVLTNLVFTADAKWSGDITTNVGWDSDNVRQGADLDISRSAPLTSGKIKVTWQAEGEIDGIQFGPTNISKDNVTCWRASDGFTAVLPPYVHDASTVVGALLTTACADG